MENNAPNSAEPIPPTTHSVSLYGQTDALDDFPVLKAFQQYVDAEQAKAHKRLMTVCVFFTIVMTIVISVFLFIIFALNRPGGKDDAAILALTEANAATQRQMFEQAQRQNEQFLQMMMHHRGQPSAAPGTMDPKLQKDYLDAKAEASRLRIAKEEAERKVAEVVANPPTPQFTMSEKERLDREADVLKREAALKASLKKQKARAAEQAELEKQLREKEKHLQLLKLYPEQFSIKAREEFEARVKAAEARSKAAEDEARTAVRQAMSARDQAEEAERSVLEEMQKLKEEKAKLEAERRQFERDRARLLKRVPAPSVKSPARSSEGQPQEKSPSQSAAPNRRPAKDRTRDRKTDDIDLEIFDEVLPLVAVEPGQEPTAAPGEENDPGLNPAGMPKKAPLSDGANSFYAEDFDIPLE